MMAILVFGIVAYRALPVSDLPTMDFPTINVQATLPGANADTMAAAVALPLEKRFSTIAGLDSMTSKNVLGQDFHHPAVQPRPQYRWRRPGRANRDHAGRTPIAGEHARPAVFNKVNPADQPVLYLALTSSTLPLSKVDYYAENLVAQTLSTVNGVAQVRYLRAVKVCRAHSDGPAAHGHSPDRHRRVQQALSDGNVNLPTGALWVGNETTTVQASGQLFNAADYEKLIVAYRNGSPVRLARLGRVIDDVENQRNLTWYNKDRAIQLVIFRQPGMNTVEVVDNVKALLPACRRNSRRRSPCTLLATAPSRFADPWMT